MEPAMHGCGRWLALGALLACAASAAAAESRPSVSARVLFPSSDYAPPKVEAPPPGWQPPQPATSRVPPPGLPLAMPSAAAAGAGDRCFSQCHDDRARCVAQPHGEAQCVGSLTPKGRGCDRQDDPAKRNACLAQVFDCSTRGAADRCETAMQQCLRGCGH
jgi:hypothetical protein